LEGWGGEEGEEGRGTSGRGQGVAIQVEVDERRGTALSHCWEEGGRNGGGREERREGGKRRRREEGGVR